MPRVRIQQAQHLTKRSLMASAAAGLVWISVTPSPLLAGAAPSAATQDLERTDDFVKLYESIVGDADVIEDALSLTLPETAENGNFVPVTILIDSPMTDADHIKKIHLLSTANPVAAIGTYHLSPLNGVARVQSRIRLAKTQDVVVVAERTDGKMLVKTVLVKVTIGGCGLGN